MANQTESPFEEIPDIPELPDEIKRAVNDGTLAVFIGAGVSRIVGCDGWDVLAENLVKRCFEEDVISFEGKEILSKEKDYRKIITVCQGLFQKKDKEKGGKAKKYEDMFYEEMEKSLKEERDLARREGDLVKTPNIYDDIIALGNHLFITTNADTHFDRFFYRPNRFSSLKHFEIANPKEKLLYQIHGSILDRESLVFTLPEYRKRYRNITFKKFLTDIFTEYTVLFIGYGLKEFEILDIILSARENPFAKGKYFQLEGFYQGEEEFLKYEREYYNYFNVDIITYNKKKTGYHQLEEVIRYWSEEIEQTSNYVPDEFQSIDEAVEQNMSGGKISNMLQKIKNDTSLRDYFFNKLSMASKPVEWLEGVRNAGYFQPENLYPDLSQQRKFDYPSVINILNALDNIALKNEDNPSQNTSDILVKIVDKIIHQPKLDEKVNIYGTDWKLLEIISRFPVDCITTKHINFIEASLRSSIGRSLDPQIEKLFLPKLIRGKADTLILELLNVILHYRKPEQTTSHEYISILDTYALKEILDRNKTGIAKICAVNAAHIGIKKMREILDVDSSHFNTVWIPAIENHSQISFPEQYECQLLQFVRDMLEVTTPEEEEEVKKFVEEWLDEGQYGIFKRLAYHLINHHYDSLSNLFWNLPYNPISSLTFHEFYELLNSHCKEFDEKQMKTVLDWVENQEFPPLEELSDSPEEAKRMIAYEKKRCLTALLDAEDKEVQRLYDLYTSKNNEEIEHPSFHVWSSGAGWVQEVSPADINEDEFKKRSNEDVATYIKSYEEDDRLSHREFGKFKEVNLASYVRRLVSSDPVKFASNLAPFLDIPPKYQLEILRGLEEAWRNDGDFEWDELLLFMNDIIKEETFWSEVKKEKGEPYSRWLADMIADLIQEGTRDDKHAFSAKRLPGAEEIILLLLKNVKNEMKMMGNLLISVLNSSKGKVFRAAIYYSCRHARLYSHNKENRWEGPIKPEFTALLNKNKESGLEFSTVVSECLSLLNYLDKGWVTEHINEIFDTQSKEHWEAAFTAYIQRHSTVYEGIYKLLRDEGHYEKALSYSFSDRDVTKRLVQNIVIGYLAGWDKLEDAEGLLYKLLQMEQIEQLTELSRFIWGFRDKDDDELKSKIKSLWRKFMELIAPNQSIKSKEYYPIASSLAKWAALVDTLDDEICGWLKVCVSTPEENWHRSLFVEALLRHVKQSPVAVAEVYLKMLKSGTYPSYKKENIIALVQGLADSEEVEANQTAFRICNMYLRNGFNLLEGISHKN